jgi:hypothetical protein
MEVTRHSISVYKITKYRLDKVGNKNDSYDDIIIRLLDCWDKVHDKSEGD